MDEESGRELYWWMHDLALGTICRGSEGVSVEALSMVPETVAVAGSIVRPRGPVESRLSADMSAGRTSDALLRAG